MLNRLLPEAVTEDVFKQLHQELSADANWTINYVVLTISSCLIATFGLISNSTAVIIGAMIIAPLMLPLRGLSFGAWQGDLKLFRSRLRCDRGCDNHSISSLVANGTDCGDSRIGFRSAFSHPAQFSGLGDRSGGGWDQ